VSRVWDSRALEENPDIDSAGRTAHDGLSFASHQPRLGLVGLEGVAPTQPRLTTASTRQRSLSLWMGAGAARGIRRGFRERQVAPVRAGWGLPVEVRSG